MKLTAAECKQISRGPCWLCGKRDSPRDPHHIHNQHCSYWRDTGRDPNQDWNVRCLCRQCHADWKHFVGEFFWSKKALAKELVARARKKYPRVWDNLVPLWAKWVASGMAVPDPYPDWGSDDL